MIATLLSLAGINVNVKYDICSWQSGQKNTSWIGPGWGGEHISIYIYIHVYMYTWIQQIQQLCHRTITSPTKRKKESHRLKSTFGRGCVCFQEGKHYNISVNPQWHDMTVQESCDHIHRWDALRLPEMSWLILLAGSKESTSTSEPVMSQKLGTPKISQRSWLIYIQYSKICLKNFGIFGAWITISYMEAMEKGKSYRLVQRGGAVEAQFFSKRGALVGWVQGKKYHPFMYMIYINIFICTYHMIYTDIIEAHLINIPGP